MAEPTTEEFVKAVISDEDDAATILKEAANLMTLKAAAGDNGEMHKDIAAAAKKLRKKMENKPGF